VWLAGMYEMMRDDDYHDGMFESDLGWGVMRRRWGRSRYSS